MLIFKISLKNIRKKLNEKLKKILTKTYDELANFLQCFDAVGWAAGRASGL